MSDSTKEIKYKIELDGHDQVATGLSHAEKAAAGFENRLDHLIERVGEYAAVYGSVEFFKDAYSDFEKFNQASLQLGNTLQNVGERAGISKDELIDLATKSAEQTEFTKDQYIEAETSLARVRGLNATTYKETLGFSADIAQSMHTSVDSVAQSMGKIISQPGEAGRHLREFGIILTQEQQKWLRAQEASHHLGVAQDFIFKELADHGYKGAAALAAINDPMHDLTVQMNEAKEELGEGIADAVKAVTPFLMEVIGDFRELVGYIKRNKDEVLEIAKAVGVGIVAFKLLNLTVVPLMEALEAAPEVEAAAAGGLEAIGIAATEALGPIGILALAIGGLVLLYENMADASQKALDDSTSGFESGAETLFNKYKAGGRDEKSSYQMTVAQEEHELDRRENAVNSRLAEEKKHEYKDTQGNITASQATTRTVAELDGDLKDIAAGRKGLENFKSKHSTFDGQGKAGKDDMGPIQSGTQTQKAEGPKVTNVNVSIQNLIDKFEVTNSTAASTPEQIQRMVAQAVVAAVNDAEILVGQQH